MHWPEWLGSDTFTITIRLIIAGVLSGVIGLERELNRHPAGFRTHLLVGLGSCLMMILSLYGFNDFIQSYSNVRFDPSRLPSYVVSGIGFLGAGTILVHGVTVRGLTTAASIWVVAGLGLVVGIGMYYVAVLTTLLVVLSLIFLNKWENLIVRNTRSETLYLIVDSQKASLSEITGIMENFKVRVEYVDVLNASELGLREVKYKFVIHYTKKNVFPQLHDKLNENDHILKIYTAEG